MTPEEAIRPLKELSARKKMADQCDQASASDIRLYHALDTAVEALEKQIPKKSTEYVDYEFSVVWTCPTCWRVHITEWKTKYCSDCGQAIDWGE